MKSKHDKTSYSSERDSEDRNSKFDKYDKIEDKYDRYDRSRSRSDSSRHNDLKKSVHG